MADPLDMIIPLLREMRQEIATGFDAIDRRMDRVESRLIQVGARLDEMNEALVTYCSAMRGRLSHPGS